MRFELLFQLLAVALAAAAGYFYWQGNTDGTFVSIVLAAVSYLLSLRFQIKARMKERVAQEQAPEDPE